MERTLNNTDLQVAREAVLQEMTKNNSQRTGTGTQALTGIVEILLLKVMIPIFVSLTSTVMAAVVKDKVLPAMKRKDAEQALDKLLTQKLNPQPELSSECLEEINQLLGPTGVIEEDIKNLYHKIKQRVEQEKVNL